MSDTKKLLKKHKLMITPSNLEKQMQELSQYDELVIKELTKELAGHVGNQAITQKQVDKINRQISTLSHMEDLLQFMILKDQLQDFKLKRMHDIEKKIQYTQHLKGEIDGIIHKQTRLMRKKIRLKERISRHFLITGLLWFPGIPVLLGLSLVLGSSFAPAFLVGILTLGLTVVMGEKIVHDYQRKAMLKDKIDVVSKERSAAIRTYMKYRQEIKSLVVNQGYYIEKFAQGLEKKRAMH